MVEPHENIEYLKSEISKDNFHSVKSLDLYYNECLLTNDVVLNSLNLEPNKEISIVIIDSISIVIKTNLEIFQVVDNYEIIVSKIDNTGIMKENLAKILKISPKIIGLQFNNEILDNTKSFNYYNICENSEIYCGLNIFILETKYIGELQLNVINKFIDQNICIPDLIHNYCDAKQLGHDSIKFEYQNNILSNENIFDLIKSSSNPTFRVINVAKIHFTDRNNKLFETSLCSNETVLELRNQLKLVSKSFDVNEILLFDSRILENNCKLNYYGVTDLYRIFSGFRLFLKSDENRLRPIYVHNNVKILEIKKMLSYSLRVDHYFINLLIENNNLENYKSIRDYGIDEMTCIDLAIGIGIIICVQDEIVEYIVKPNTTFDDIKQYISFKFRINTNNIKLMFENREISQVDNLVEMSIKFPDLVISVKPSVFIKINLNNGDKISLEVWDRMKIVHLKELISANSRICKESFVLELNSRELNDDRTMEYYQINSGSELKMVVRDRVAIIDEDQNLHCVIIEPTHTIFTLKQMYSLKIKKHPNYIHLYQHEFYLNDDQTIASSDINVDSLLQSKLGIRIRLVDESDKQFDLVVSESATIGGLKELLFSNYGFEINKTKLILNEIELFDKLFINNIKFDMNYSLIKIVRELIQATPISIYVCNLLNNNILHFNIETDYTIRDIKKLIFENVNVDLNDFLLSFLGKKLDDSTHLYQLKIQENQTVILKSKYQCNCIENLSEMVINVSNINEKNETGSKIYKFIFDDYQSILNLKHKLRDQLNVSIDRITLNFQGKTLEDNDTFRSLDIDNESTLLMTIANQETIENKDNIIIKIRNDLLPESHEEPIKDIVIEKCDPISKLKQTLANQLNVPLNSFVLVFNDEIMLDRNFPESYGMNDGSEVVVCHSVLIKHFSGQDMDTSTVRRFPVESTDRIIHLKKRIARKLNIQYEFVKLIYQSEYLEDDNYIQELEIEHDSFIMMITTLKGGDSGKSIVKFEL